VYAGSTIVCTFGIVRILVALFRGVTRSPLRQLQQRFGPEQVPI
jgi:hypothetical protein